MGEFRTNFIQDGAMYKISFSKDGKQQKVSIANVKDLSLMSASRIALDVDELVDAGYSWDMLKAMHKLNHDKMRAGYSGNLIKYSNITIDLAMRIMYPEQYSKSKQLAEEEPAKKQMLYRGKRKPIAILNVGCTATGKTRYILGSLLNLAELKNFTPSLTSVKETTACSIVYHINADYKLYSGQNDFAVKVYLKSGDAMKADIYTLVIEAFEEYIDAIHGKAKDEIEISEIRSIALTAVEKRLELNNDKTFGLGERSCNTALAEKIEQLVKKAILDYYGSSKSIERIAGGDEYYIIKQLVNDFMHDDSFISSDEIFKMANQYVDDSPFVDVVSVILNELGSDLQKFKNEYRTEALLGGEFLIQGIKKNPDTMLLLSHIFGNKKLQASAGLYTVEPLIDHAEFFLDAEQYKWIGRELIISDSVGINQGQKDAKRKREIALRRVQESIQDKCPQIILYHTRLITNDDYLMDIVKELKVEGYGKFTYVIAGRLDTVLRDRLTDEGLEMNGMSKDEFGNFIGEIKAVYVYKDMVSLEPLIGSNYYICDKTNSIGKEIDSAVQYECPAVMKRILEQYREEELGGIRYQEIEFMEKLEENYVCENVYSKYLEHIPEMIPLNYNSMRWNTLQKAIEILHANGWGFDSLYPALSIRDMVANELNKAEAQQIFLELFGEKADEVLQRYLLQAADTAQVVLVTEYKTFMMALIKMRYDLALRTDLSTTMTNDRKYNLQRLYSKCLEQEGLRGEYGMKMVFHIAWLRTVDAIEQEFGYSG